MSKFWFYLNEGFAHISDLAGYDHIVFIVAMCACYSYKEWKKLTVLVTAFTVGHSITLALAAMNVLSPSQEVIEFFIPVTIVLTALYNVLSHKLPTLKLATGWNYLLVLVFGLIHGCGFSTYFKSLLMPGESLVGLLLPFNIGVELGQLLIVAILLVLAFVALQLLQVRKREWNLWLSGIAAGPAIIMTAERWPF